MKKKQLLKKVESLGEKALEDFTKKYQSFYRIKTAFSKNEKNMFLSGFAASQTLKSNGIRS